MRDRRKLVKAILIAWLMIATAAVPISLVTGSASAFGGYPDDIHPAIYINGDADFDAQALAEGWPGTGSSGDPYIIADYDIYTDVSDGITIQYTTRYFIISSCDLAITFGMVNKGILLNHTQNGVVTGVVSQGNAYGIVVNDSSNIEIIGGVLEPYGFTYYPDYSYNWYFGVYVRDSDHVNITDVTNWANYYNLYIARSDQVTVTGGDQAQAAAEGIYAGNCVDLTLQSLSATGNPWNGIEVRSSTNVEIAEVICSANSMNGIYLSGVSNALVWGSVGDGITPSTLWLYSNSLNGIQAMSCTNLTIQGGDFGGYFSETPYSNSRSGIFLQACINPLIQDSIATSNYNYWNGITLVYCTDASLIDCSANNNYLSNGFHLAGCNGTTMIGCTATLNDKNGLYLNGGSNLSITSCTFSENLACGIYGTGTLNLSLNDCDASSNTQNGVYLLSCSAPTSISSITADSNGWNGVHLQAVPNATIIGGSASSNTWNGIYLKSSNNVLVDGGAVMDSNLRSGLYAAFCSNLVVNDSSLTYNNWDGVYVGACQSPSVTNCLSSGNTWWGVRSLGCSFVTLLDNDLSGNGFGPSYWPNSPPTASFTVNRIDDMNDPTVFNASASSDLDGTIVTYEWNWGDGNFSTVGTAVTTHQYATMDNYAPTLRVRDNGGKWSLTPATKNLAIQTEICAKIIMPDRAAVNDDVTLSGAYSFHFDGARTISAYAWDFDDGSNASGVSPVHAWTTQGTYNVALRVQDDLGRWSPVVHSRIIIGTDAVVGLAVSADRHSLLLGETTMLTITAVDGAGKKVDSFDAIIYAYVNQTTDDWTGLNISVGMFGGEVSIPISCSNSRSYNITAEVEPEPSIRGWEYVTIAASTVEVRVYDLGQFYLGSYNDTMLNIDPVDTCGPYEHSYWHEKWRGKWGDQPFRYATPMVYNQYSTGADKLASNIDTTCRINAEARNIMNMNMADPTFFPRMNAGPGGNLSFTWDYNYLNLSEFWWWNIQPDPSGQHPQNPYQWSLDDQNAFYYPEQFFLYSQGISAYDGWETLMFVDITMDRDAAWQIIGLPDDGTDPFYWWDRHTGLGYNDTVRAYLDGTFFPNEGGGILVAGRLDIKSCDDGYSWQAGFWNSYYRLVDNGDDTVTLQCRRVGYGEDTLIARWLYWGGVSNGWNYPNGTPGGIMPFEMYYDDFHMVGDMDNVSTNLAFDTGMIYAFRSQKSADPDIPPETAVWRFEQVRIDYAVSTGDGTNNRSEMDLWGKNGMTFEVWDPAGSAWGITIQADQTPNIMTFGLGQSLIMERPRTLVSGILPGPLVGDISMSGDRYGSGYNDWILIQEKWGNATIHPLGCPIVNDEYTGGMTPTYVMDKATGDVTIVGPFFPIIDYYEVEGFTWLWEQSAPLIEYWIQ